MTEQTTSDAAKLLSCPFCGGAATIEHDCGLFLIRCRNDLCLAEVKVGSGIKERAIEFWNTRAPSPPPSGDEGDAREIRERWSNPKNEYEIVAYAAVDISRLLAALDAATARIKELETSNAK